MTDLNNLHLSQPVATSGCDINSAKCIAIMMHGRDRDTDDILQVARRLNLEGIAYLAPAAHGNSWYPDKFMQPLEKNQPYLDHALATVDKLVNDVRAKGFKNSQILFLGFSQGASLVSEYVVRHATRYGGVVVFTGGLIGPEGTRWELGGDFQGTPVFLGSSDVDEWVPESRVYETAKVMERMGANVEVKIYKDMEHIINDNEITKARQIFHSALIN